MEKGFSRERIVSQCPINNGVMNDLHPLSMPNLTSVASGPSLLKAKVAVKVNVAQTLEEDQSSSRYGVTSVNDQDTLRTGAMTTLTGPGEILSPTMSFGVIHVTALVTPPVHVLSLPSRSLLKEKGNCCLPKAVQASTVIEAGRVKTSQQHTTPNTPPQYSKGAQRWKIVAWHQAIAQSIRRKVRSGI
jgi:hypothetical protein